MRSFALGIDNELRRTVVLAIDESGRRCAGAGKPTGLNRCSRRKLAVPVDADEARAGARVAVSAREADDRAPPAGEKLNGMAGGA